MSIEGLIIGSQGYVLYFANTIEAVAIGVRIITNINPY